MKIKNLLLTSVLLVTFITANVFGQLPKNRMVAYYPFSGNSNDTSGNGKHAKINTNVLTSDRFGKLNSAYEFDGVDDYIDLGTWFNFQSFSISLWVNAGATQTTYADIIDNNHTGARSFVLQQNAGSTNNYGWGITDGGSGIGITLTANTWTHITLTRDSATRVNVVYINGVKFGSFTSTKNVYYDGSQFLRLGRWGSGGRNWKGKMDEVAIWTRALDSNEVKTVYNDNSCSLSADAGENKTICKNDKINLSVTDNGGAKTTYLWSNASTTKSINVTPLSNTIYKVTVTDSLNCKIIDSVEVIVQECTNIENVLASNFTISPNPAQNFITISGKIEVESYKVYDIAGKEIIVGNGNLVNVSNLNKGIYFVRVTAGDNKIYNSKFIKE